MLDTYFLVKFLVTFLLLIFTLYIIYYYLKKKAPAIKQNGKIHVEEINYIDRNRQILLIRVKDTEFLILNDEKGAIVIKEWERSEQ
ncbi:MULTISPECIES: hypothetical protein [unclassified Nitratiruptor]|uniref:hypothetical protein n=1 Tax=unclassified Nitratiruptor TaxID=2624044 RepID=UPI0019154C58|nr:MULTISPECIES: hypothetical protein [unclassified Nitratiruptor]